MKRKSIGGIIVIIALAVSACVPGKQKSDAIPYRENSGSEYAARKAEKEEKETARQDKQQANRLDEGELEGLEIPEGGSNQNSMTLQREGFTVSYNKQTKIPNWVAWHLTADRLSGEAKRKGIDFESDTDVPTPRADDYDYYNSGYDRGHMCPAADNKFSLTAMQQSFLFSNICPQEPNLNRGDWNELEITCRKWAKLYDGVYIVCGPILYSRKHKTIGKHKVTVPEAFFKVVLRLGTEPKAIGFIYKNESGDHPKNYYVNTVDQVERITGFDFFSSLPDDIETEVEAKADISDWRQ